LDTIGLDGIQSLGIPTNACERFTRAANDPEISGIYARHSKRYSEVPSNPMSEFEARQFIAYLLAHWTSALAKAHGITGWTVV
jgi:hypothetical protein